MTGLRASLIMSMCLGLLALAPLSAVSSDDADKPAERVTDAAAKRPATRVKEGGANRRSHKLREASKAKKTTPKTSFGTVAAPGANKGAEKTPPARDSHDNKAE